ncbi:hypothetical protein SAMN05216360_12513 [Methylobacterium phyllostachyos]|uniref:Uncharacterized protein n=1 Tax=Methylobacterium phyllostachyos TaxID=582672 RepID=A0A1H0K647_9HYPH|nr:hypothetical protein [Methylobacterium phyllostachyos]SDO51354.1 hypothetical protein SAMN05216360_12513 [Methylobacterium phyllostachyos]
MTPAAFLDEVAHPNMVAALTDPDDMRAIVNAILSLDTLAGILHAAGADAGDHRMAGLATDDVFRDMLAGVSDSYRVLRDAAASLKHGALKHKKARLVRRAAAFQTRLNGFGLMQCGDRLGMNVVVIETDPGPGFVRASDIVADSYRMLARLVHGKLAGIDEHDRGAFYLTGPEKVSDG